MWLEGADHFYSTLFYRHNVKFYTALIDFLANDCFGNDESVASNDWVHFSAVDFNKAAVIGGFII